MGVRLVSPNPTTLAAAADHLADAGCLIFSEVIPSPVPSEQGLYVLVVLHDRVSDPLHVRFATTDEGVKNIRFAAGMHDHHVNLASPAELIYPQRSRS
jgi:hypothetical protein